MAAQKGLADEALARDMAMTLQNPTSDFMAHCRDESTKLALMEPHKYDSITATLTRITNKSLPLKLIQPFISIQSNILKQSYGERTPVGLLSSSEMRENLFGKNGPVAQQEQAGKMIVGSLIGTAAGVAAAQGMLTGGGPTDPREKAIWLAAGNEPYSVRVKDLWVSYRGGPIGTVMGSVADAVELMSRSKDEDMDEIAKGAVAGLGKNLLDESNVRGFHDALDAMLHPQENGARYVRNMVGNFIPWSVGLGQITRAIDPERRHVESYSEMLKAHIPGLSESLLPSRDIFGEPIRQASIVPGIADIANENRIAKEMLDLGVFPGKLGKTINDVDLTEKQYDDYQRIAGRYFTVHMTALMGLPGWSEIPSTMRADVISKHLAEARSAARAQMKIEYPDIVAQAAQNRADDIRARMGR